MKACQAYAFIKGRSFVLPDDVQFLAPYAFSHRLILKPEAKYKGMDPSELIRQVLSRLEVPVQRPTSV